MKDLAVALRKVYEAGKSMRNKDYDQVVAFLDALCASDRLQPPLRGVLVIGY